MRHMMLGAALVVSHRPARRSGLLLGWLTLFDPGNQVIWRSVSRGAWRWECDMQRNGGHGPWPSATVSASPAAMDVVRDTLMQCTGTQAQP